eukprot:CCRYP_001190-RB/>CCRYP_001190-RB protein AED:0.47 eAED:0.47 QI:0/0/0/1/0/0/2/0/59
MFAAVRGNENKKLMETEWLKDLWRISLCVASILGFLLSFFGRVEDGRMILFIFSRLHQV